METKVKRRCACRRELKLQGAPRALRPALMRFAETHQECCRQVAVGAKSPHRCVTCGMLLLFGERCLEHPGAVREFWPETLEAAYQAEEAARRRGHRVEIMVGPAGDLAFTAWRWAERWAAEAAAAGAR